MTTTQPTVTVIGSANTDLVVRVPRLPGPGETVIGGDLVIAGGGKGANQAIAARRLGADVTFVARVGGDAFGDQAIAALNAEGIRTEYVRRTPDAPSGVALIVVDDRAENQIAVAPGANSRLTPADVAAASPAIASSAVIVAQLEVPIATVRAAVTAARQAGKTVVLNPAPAPGGGLPDDLLADVDVLNPNRSEASVLTGVAVEDPDSAAEAARRLLRRGIRTVVITLGKDGALLATNTGVELVSGFAVNAIDTTGAGDAFTAGLAVALARGADPTEAVRFACATGAVATTRLGAQPSMPHRHEVEALLG